MGNFRVHKPRLSTDPSPTIVGMEAPEGKPEDDIVGPLARWPTNPGEGVRVRFLETIGGGRRIQVRLELGIIQMECRGRPDGARPLGNETELEAARESADPWNAERCQRLLDEAAQYQQRAFAYLALKEFALAALDCTRNIEAAEAIRHRAGEAVNQQGVEEMRCASVLLRTRAVATAALAMANPAAALKAIDRGLADLGPSVNSGLAGWSLGRDAAALRMMRETLVPRLPSSQRVELEERLAAALRLENYELAAILRNELRQI